MPTIFDNVRTAIAEVAQAEPLSSSEGIKKFAVTGLNSTEQRLFIAAAKQDDKIMFFGNDYDNPLGSLLLVAPYEKLPAYVMTQNLKDIEALVKRACHQNAAGDYEFDTTPEFDIKPGKWPMVGFLNSVAGDPSIVKKYYQLPEGHSFPLPPERPGDDFVRPPLSGIVEFHDYMQVLGYAERQLDKTGYELLAKTEMLPTVVISAADMKTIAPLLGLGRSPD